MIFIGMIIIINHGTQDEPQTPPSPMPIVTPPKRTIAERGEIEINCPKCDWFNRYETIGLAKMGLSAHERWCKRGKGTKANIFG